MKVSRRKFEDLVAAGISAIPERFLGRIKNLAVVIEDEPSPEQLEENGVPEDETLLGLFEGVPAGSQGSGPWEMPCKITVFQRPTEEEADSEEEIAEIVRDTVWHEIAHYFGMDESEVLAAEEKRRQRKQIKEGS